MKKLFLLCAVTLLTAIGAMGATTAAGYCNNFDGYTTTDSKYTKGLSFECNGVITSVNVGQGFFGTRYYNNTSTEIPVVAGQTVTITPNAQMSGQSQVHSYFFVDWNNDKTFANGWDSDNLAPTTDSELMAFSYYKDPSADHGVNNQGQTVDDTANLTTVISFTVPEGTADGNYYARYIVQQNDLDPCGNESKVASNGGVIVDLVLKVGEGGATVDPEPATDYCNNWPTQTVNRSDRRTNKLTFTVGDQTVAEATDMQTGNGSKVYWNKRQDTRVTVHPGETLTITPSGAGEWMHNCVYVDWGNDFTFDSAVDAATHKPAAGSDLMGFCYYQGYNSNGEAAQNNTNGFRTPISFVIPEGTEAGEYVGRYLVHWDDIDPCGGSASSNNPLPTAGGVIVDFTVVVEEASAPATQMGTVTLEPCENGTINAVCNGVTLASGDQVAVGSIVTFSATPAAGYVLKTFRINGANMADVVLEDGEISYEMESTEGLTVSATFESTAPAKLVVNLPACEHGTVTASASMFGMNLGIKDGDEVQNGMNIKFTVTPDEGYEVASFTINGQDKTAELDDSNELTVTVAGESLTAAATFTEASSDQEYTVTATVTEGADLGRIKLESDLGFMTMAFNSGEKVAAGVNIKVTLVPTDGAEVKSFTMNGVDKMAELTDNVFTIAVNEALNFEAAFQAAQAPETLPTYCNNYPTEVNGNNGRKTAMLSFFVNNEAAGNTGTLQMTNRAPIYWDKTSVEVTAHAGENFRIAPSGSGAWMHNFAYVDWGKDGEFASTWDATTHTPTAGCDLMAYCYYNPEPDEANGKAGWNSKGVDVPEDTNGYSTSIDFDIPEGTPAGKYVARYIVAWNSIDPCGENGHDFLDNAGGIIVDFVINVEDGGSQPATQMGTVTLEPCEHGTINAVHNDQAITSGTQVPVGDLVTFSATADDGYVLKTFRINGSDMADVVLEDGEITYEMESTEGLTVSATFEATAPVPTKLVVNLPACEHGAVTASTTVAGVPMSISNGDEVQDGMEITFAVSPEDGYEVATFTINGEDKTAELNDSNELTVTVAGQSLTAAATFQEVAAPATEYCNNFANGETSSFSRKTSSMVITNVTTGESVTLDPLQSGWSFPVYFDKTENVLTVAPGDSIQIQPSAPGHTWMHNHIVADWNQDYVFNVDWDATTHMPAVGSELMDYSAHSADASNWFNGHGQTADNKLGYNFKLAFKVPAEQPTSDVRARYYLSWNNFDPCGDNYTKDALAGTGGIMVDFTIHVEAPKAPAKAIVIPAANSGKHYLWRADDIVLGSHTNGTNNDISAGEVVSRGDNRARSFTVSAWVRAHAAEGQIFGHGQRDYYDAVGTFGVALKNGKLVLKGRTWQGGGQCDGFTDVTGANLDQDEWAFLTVAVNDDARTIALYKNGTKCAEASLSASGNGAAAYGIGLLADDCIFFACKQDLAMDLEQYQVWTRTLTDQEIAESMNADYSATVPADLAGLWSFDSETTTSVANKGNGGESVGELLFGNSQYSSSVWAYVYQGDPVQPEIIDGHSAIQTAVASYEITAGETLGTVALTQDGVAVANGGNVIVGKDLTITLTPGEGANVETFTVNGEDHKADLVENAYTMTVDGNVDVKVAFAAAWKIDVQIVGNGTVKISDDYENEYAQGTACIPDGTYVYILCTPAEGETFISLEMDGEPVSADDLYEQGKTKDAREYELGSVSANHSAKATFSDASGIDAATIDGLSMAINAGILHVYGLTEPAVISVFAANGTLVAKTAQTVVDLTALPTGSYVVNVKTAKAATSATLLKK